MRLSEYKLHILGLVILLLSSIGLFLVFQFTITNGLESQAKNQAGTITNGDLYRVNMLIENYTDFFEKEYPVAEIDDVNIVADAVKRFCRQLIIEKASIMESKGEDAYFAYITNSTKTRFGKMDISLLFSNNDEGIQNLMYSPNGEIIYSSTDVSNQFYDLLRVHHTEGFIDEYKNTLLTENSSVLKVNILDGEYFLVTYHFGEYFYAEIILTSSLISRNHTFSITISLYIALFIVFALSLVIIILMIKHNSKAASLNKGSYKASNLLVVRVDKRGIILKGNKAFNKTFGNKEMFSSINSFVGVENQDLLGSCKKEQSFIVEHINDAGKKQYFSFNSVGNAKGYYLFGSNITKKYTADSYLLNLSSKNSTTGENNLLKLASEFDDLKEIAKKQIVNFVELNIIGFREINKVLGRKAGDMVLIEFAKMIKEMVETRLYHVDGDTFLCVSTKTAGELDAACNKLLKRCKEPLFVAENQLFIKPKIAILAIQPSNSEEITLDECTQKLEITLKKAKTTINRDILYYDSSLEYFVKKNSKMQEDLMNAVKNNEFRMYYQPQFDIVTNRIVGFEALIRWMNPQYASVTPQEFIEMSEQNGCIIQIGDFVLNDVFKAAQTFEKYNVHLSCNVSPAQIVQAGFVQALLEKYNANKLQPGAVAIEITETFLMENFSTVVEKLKILQARGFSIHLDDFGTGYSSMLYLKELPIDTIKIDKEFIKHIETDKFSRAIVKKIISLGLDLDLSIICEGVETNAQSNLVKKMGCKIIQGYLIGKAMPMEDALKLVEKYNGSLK